MSIDLFISFNHILQFILRLSVLDVSNITAVDFNKVITVNLHFELNLFKCKQHYKKLDFNKLYKQY